MNLAEKLAWAIWAADVKAGQMFTPWDELGAPGKEAYLKDANHMLETTHMVGLEIAESINQKENP